MIQIRNLTYDYPEKRALNDVSFEIQEGAITALVGPNGSGKTTLLRNLAALTKPLSGEILINGSNAVTQPHEVHLQTGFLQDNFGLYEHLTVLQSLQFMAHSRLPANSAFENAVQLAASRAEVESFIDKKINTLSRGMRQRVGIAQAIIHNPKVLLLDEPASGLDPEARYSLSKLLVELRYYGMTMIVSSHILAELEDYSTDLLVIHEGRVLEHRSLKAYTQKSNLLVIEISFADAGDNLNEIISAINGVVEVNTNGNKFSVTIDTLILQKHDLLKQLTSMNLMIEEFSEIKLNLQDEYMKTVFNHKQSKEK